MPAVATPLNDFTDSGLAMWLEHLSTHDATAPISCSPPVTPYQKGLAAQLARERMTDRLEQLGRPAPRS